MSVGEPLILFQNVYKISKVKVTVEKELGEWKGDKVQNQLADLEISICVKTSFKKYEENKLKKGKSYFKF